MLLASTILGDVDDAACAQGHLHVWLPILGAFVALGEAKGTAQGSAKTCLSHCHTGQSWGPFRGPSQVAQTEVPQSLQHPPWQRAARCPLTLCGPQREEPSVYLQGK